MRSLLPVLTLALVLISGGVAHAHKVIASVYAEGAVIEGEIGFSNGDMAPADTLVEVFDPSGAKIGEVRTDKDGVFRYQPAAKQALTFRADLGGGHVAETSMTAEEVPGTGDGAPVETPAAAASGESGTALAQSADIKALVAEAVRDEVKPLRREIAAYREKNDLQAILGGIGYIVGLFGIGFYLVARHKLRQA